MNKRLLARILPLAAILVAAPVDFSGDEGVTANEACANIKGGEGTGTCCPQPAAICNAGAGDHKGYFLKSSGSC